MSKSQDHVLITRQRTVEALASGENVDHAGVYLDAGPEAKLLALVVDDLSSLPNPAGLPK